MGLETATYIGQLNASNPASGDPVSEGDNHLRLIKSVLQSQFTSLGNAAVTVTAAQLNAVTSKLTSFNGRTTPAAVPAAGDYSADMLSDVTITTPAIGQILSYNGSQWVNVRGGAAITSGVFLYDTYAGAVTDSLYFSTQQRMTVSGSVATIKNNGSGGIGWTLTAAAACLVQLNMQLANDTTGGFDAAAAIGVTYSPFTPPATMPGASNDRLAYATTRMNDGDITTLSVSASTILAAGDVLTVYRSGTWSFAGATLSGTVISL